MELLIAAAAAAAPLMPGTVLLDATRNVNVNICGSI